MEKSNGCKAHVSMPKFTPLSATTGMQSKSHRRGDTLLGVDIFELNTQFLVGFMGLKVTKNHFGLIVTCNATKALLVVCMNKFDFDYR